MIGTPGFLWPQKSYHVTWRNGCVTRFFLVTVGALRFIKKHGFVSALDAKSPILRRVLLGHFRSWNLIYDGLSWKLWSPVGAQMVLKRREGRGLAVREGAIEMVHFNACSPIKINNT
jgi:hypothetical protein